MSQENVERVREGYLQWKTERNLDTTMIDPEIEWWFIGIDGSKVSYRGLDGFEKWLGLMRESWEDLWWEPERMVDAGDHVVAFVTAHVRGRGSGIELEVPLGNLWTFRDGRAVRFEMFMNPDEALEAAGLSE
jgi:ketosteroid isomerase-like protein